MPFQKYNFDLDIQIDFYTQTACLQTNASCLNLFFFFFFNATAWYFAANQLHSTEVSFKSFSDRENNYMQFLFG